MHKPQACVALQSSLPLELLRRLSASLSCSDRHVFRFFRARFTQNIFPSLNRSATSTFIAVTNRKDCSVLIIISTERISVFPLFLRGKFPDRRFQEPQKSPADSFRTQILIRVWNVFQILGHHHCACYPEIRCPQSA